MCNFPNQTSNTYYRQFQVGDRVNWRVMSPSTKECGEFTGIVMVVMGFDQYMVKGLPIPIGEIQASIPEPITKHVTEREIGMGEFHVWWSPSLGMLVCGQLAPDRPEIGVG